MSQQTGILASKRKREETKEEKRGEDEQDAFAIVKPIVKIQDALSDLKSFEQMKSKLLSNSDYQPIQGKNFIKKSGWRKLALVFNISDQVVEKTRENKPNGSFVWTFRVRATAPNGRFTESVGSCDSAERKFTHAEHDVLATAHTRAKSRAISDLIGAGEITAEELRYDDSDGGQSEGRDAASEEKRLGITSARRLSPSSVERDAPASDFQPRVRIEPASSEDCRPGLRQRKFELLLDHKKYPLKESEGLFSKFFVGRICKSVVAKYPSSWFELERDGSNRVESIAWYNLPEDEKVLKDISNILDWTIRKIEESKKGKNP